MTKFDQQVVLYTGGFLILPNDIVKDDLWVQGGKIIDPRTVNYNSDRVVDISGRLVSPGFIDLKINGCFGINFSNPKHLTEGSIDYLRSKLGEFGVTSFCPCVTTCSSETYRSILPNFQQLGDKPGSEILGLHLDGPLHSKKKGHKLPSESPLSAKIDQISTVEDLEALYGGFDNIKIVSMAPELSGVKERIIPGLVERGVKVSLGHTVCSIEDAEQAVNAGATMIGHLFNGMPNFHHRDPSLVGLLASTEIGDNPIYFGLIADLIHTHPASLAMAHKLHPKTLMIVSDAVSALGLAKVRDIENVFTHTDASGNAVDIRRSVSRGDEDGEMGVAAYEHGSNQLIGSCTPLDEAIKNLLYYTDATLLEAIQAVTSRPAKALDVYSRKGNLHYGSDADFVTMDKHLNILSTYAKGDLIYRRPNDPAPGTPRAEMYADKVEFLIRPLNE